MFKIFSLFFEEKVCQIGNGLIMISSVEQSKVTNPWSEGPSALARNVVFAVKIAAPS